MELWGIIPSRGPGNRGGISANFNGWCHGFSASGSQWSRWGSIKEESSQEPHPTFGPNHNTQSGDFNLKKEVEHLPFKLNLGDIPLEKEHQAKFIALIYSNHEVFSLHDEDLGYCDWLTHTILTSMNRPVYLLHRTILMQLQGEVCKCLNTWLCQGIIHQSNSSYTSQAVIVHKNPGRFISMCITGD